AGRSKQGRSHAEDGGSFISLHGGLDAHSMYEKLTMLNLQSGSNWSGPNNWYHDPTGVQTQHSTVSEGCMLDTEGSMGGEAGGGGSGRGGGGGGGGVPVERDEGEESQLRLQLKRKLQRNRTSFTQEQIEALEKGQNMQARKAQTFCFSEGRSGAMMQLQHTFVIRYRPSTWLISL
ncbi:hypothetical protein XENOCAPTIV_011246, partial [Xenoophorus captivus]